MNDKQQLASMGEHMAEKPTCMGKRIEDLEGQVRVMAEALREAISVLSSINHGGEHEVHVDGDDPAFWQRGEWVVWAKSDVLPKLQAALSGKLPTPAVPEGWQLVPVEVTLPMQHAYFGVIDKNMQRVETDCRFGRYDSAKEAYRAMLSASPKPEAK